MRQRSSSAIEQLRRRGRLFARDLRLGHIGAGRRWPPYLRPAAITLILALATALVVAQNFLPNRLNLRAGEVSSQDVVSPRSVRYESQTRRDEARAAAATQVPDQFDGSVSSQQRQAIDTLATKVAELRRSSSSGPDRSAQLSLLEPQLSDAQRQYLLQAEAAGEQRHQGRHPEERLGHGADARGGPQAGRDRRFGGGDPDPGQPEGQLPAGGDDAQATAGERRGSRRLCYCRPGTDDHPLRRPGDPLPARGSPGRRPAGAQGRLGAHPRRPHAGPHPLHRRPRLPGPVPARDPSRSATTRHARWVDARPAA
ncbi:MAG: hypothetical protein E6J07_07135, partial [Chloroflexi bacterium]